MHPLLQTIRDAVEWDAIVTSNHADDRLRERRVELWQILNGIDDAQPISSRPNDLPNPSVLVRQTLADGTPVTVVWAWVESARLAMLVPEYFTWTRP